MQEIKSGGDVIMKLIEITIQTDAFVNYSLVCQMDGTWSIQYKGVEFAKVPGDQVGQILARRAAIPAEDAGRWSEVCVMIGGEGAKE